MSWKKTFNKILIIYFLFLSFPTFANEEVTLVTLDWPPLTDSNIPNQGSITELVVKAFSTQGINAHIKFLPWARALEAAKNGEYAGIFPAYFSKERENDFYFSDSLENIKVGFIKLKKTPINYQLQKDNLNFTYDIFKKNNYKIGVIKSYSNEEIFDKRTDLNKIVYGKDEQAVKAIITKKIDMYFGDNIFYKDYLTRKEPELLNDFEFVEPAILEKGLYLIFPKKIPSSETLRNKFNAGLKLIHK